ncbi:low temperature requirement protein A [Streptomyces sp. TR06-5]|uniref:low temperature requirement protein A n=1 Tax=unclassified Streptomyces TaxID=2593676 RepID=UPI00399F439B
MGGGNGGRTPAGALRRVMRGRDPEEVHRAATPLELLFDLTFVVAVAQAAAELHHGLAEGHPGSSLAGYAAVFFAIWWAWMNFSWFASAYDTDDVAYRVLTLVQMAGVLVLAAGVQPAFEDRDFTVIVIGYVVMRIALVAQWLRAAAEHPRGRDATLRYAVGIALAQAGWVAWLWAPEAWAWPLFLLLAAIELVVPAWAEVGGLRTPWHAGHIAERYGLFTIIVLGEVVLATLSAVRRGVSEGGLSADLMLVALGALLLVFSLWWIFFSGAEVRLPTLRVALTWGYAHYVVFGAIAAIGSGLAVALDHVLHHAHLSARAAALTVAVPVAVVLAVLTFLHRLTAVGAVEHVLVVAAGALVVVALGVAASAIGVGGAVLGMGLAVTATLVANLVVVRHRGRGEGTP